MTLELELLILWAALIIYVLAGSLVIVAAIFRQVTDDIFQGLLWLGLGVHTAAITYRWIRLEHGPFLTMFEILSSNIWSVTLFFALTYWRIPSIRPVATIMMPILFMMMGWLMLAYPGESVFPPTYNTIWLYIHIGFGKVFMGALMIASALSCIVLLRDLKPIGQLCSSMPVSNSVSELSFRFLALALVFESLMLVAGAIWAQDAWGRYWAWDPLETWSFITWLVLAITLHVRITWPISTKIGAMLILIVFVIAFLTFFGVPFISTAPHKGAV